MPTAQPFRCIVQFLIIPLQIYTPSSQIHSRILLSPQKETLRYFVVSALSSNFPNFCLYEMPPFKPLVRSESYSQ